MRSLGTPGQCAGTITAPPARAKLAGFDLRRDTPSAILITVTGAEFIRRLRHLAPRRRVAFRMDTRRGRGSHRVVYFGTRWTTVKDLKNELGKGLFRQMCSDLGIESTDLS
jgi:mRNA interferase HicA